MGLFSPRRWYPCRSCALGIAKRVAMLTLLLVPDASASAQTRVITDADVARILPMLRSPLGRTARAQSAAMRGEAGVNDYMTLTREAAQPGFDAQQWIAARTTEAALPPGARFLRDCSRELPVAAVKVPLPAGELRSEAFTPTAVHALAGDGAVDGAIDAARQFYRQRGFIPAGVVTHAQARLLAPDSTLLVTISRANPHAGEALLRPACSRVPGPVVELVLFRTSWADSDRGWTRERYEAELARHGLEHTEYWNIVRGLYVARFFARSPEWNEWGPEERALFPAVPVYLRHATVLDPLLDLLDDEAIDR